MSGTKAVIERRSQVARVRQNALALQMAKLAEDDMDDLMATKKAAELASPEAGEALMALPKDELEKLGWTRRSLQLAIDAKRNSKETPYYVKMLDNRVVARWRDGVGEKPSSAAKVIMPVQFIVNQAERDAAPIINIGGETVDK